MPNRKGTKAIKKTSKKTDKKKAEPIVAPAKSEKKVLPTVKKVERPQLPKPPLEVMGALSLRREIRRSRPRFVRQESWRYKRIAPSWRRPKGIDSKMRLERKGWPAKVKVGYGSPTIAKGLHPSGFKDVLVSSVRDLEQLNPKTDAARFSASLGARKRSLLFNRARDLGIKVLNPRRITVPSRRRVSNS